MKERGNKACIGLLFAKQDGGCVSVLYFERFYITRRIPGELGQRAYSTRSTVLTGDVFLFLLFILAVNLFVNFQKC